MGITSVEWRRGLSSRNNARFGSTSGLSCLRGNLRKEGVGELDGEGSFADFRGICGGYAGELRADVVDDVEIAVGAVGCLFISSEEIPRAEQRVGSRARSR